MGTCLFVLLPVFACCVPNGDAAAVEVWHVPRSQQNLRLEGIARDSHLEDRRVPDMRFAESLRCRFIPNSNVLAVIAGGRRILLTGYIRQIARDDSAWCSDRR